MSRPIKFVKGEIVKYLLDNPTVSLKEAAAEFGGSTEMVRIIAKKEGLFVYKEWRRRGEVEN